VQEVLTDGNVWDVVRIAAIVGVLLLAVWVLTVIIKSFIRDVKGSIKGKIAGQEFEICGAETAAPSVKSPEDSVSLPPPPRAEVVSEPSASGIPPFREHSFIRLLAQVRCDGLVMKSGSGVKLKVVSEFVQLFCNGLYSATLDWVEAVESSDGKKLENISKLLRATYNRVVEGSYLHNFRVTKLGQTYLLRGIPAEFVTKFDIYFKPMLSPLESQLSNLVYSIYHPTWRSKLMSCLDVMEALFRVSFVAVNSAVRELNGELEELIDTKLEKPPNY